MVIRADARAADDRRGAGQDALAAPLGVVEPAEDASPTAASAPATPGSSASTWWTTSRRPGSRSTRSTAAATRSRPRWTATCSTRCSASLKAEVPPKQPNVANNMSVVAARQGQAPGAGDGAPAGTFGLKAVEEQTSYGLPYEPVRLGAGSIYKIFTAATALEKGLGINYQLAVPPSGYASPIYIDGGGRPIPVRNAGDYPAPDDAAGRAGAVAEHRVHQARGVHRGPGRGGHGRTARDALAGRRPVHRPAHAATHRPLDRRGHQGAEAGLVHPRGEPAPACWSWPTSAPRWPARACGARRARSSRSPTPPATRCR